MDLTFVKNISRASAQGACSIVQDKATSKKYFKKAFKEPPEGGNRDQAISRLEREGDLLRKLNAANVKGVPTLVEEKLDGDPSEMYLLMEYLDGGDLAGFFGSRHPLSEHQALVLFRKLLVIVCECHNVHIVHRDIKPANIILRNRSLEDPVLVDFGISHLQSEDETITLLEDRMGNAFCPLQELQAAEPSELEDSAKNRKRNKRSDVALCCAILCHSLTLERTVRTHQTEQEMLAYEKRSAIATASPVVQRILFHGLRTNFQDRPTAAELLAMLDSHQGPSFQDVLATLSQTGPSAESSSTPEVDDQLLKRFVRKIMAKWLAGSNGVLSYPANGSRNYSFTKVRATFGAEVKCMVNFNNNQLPYTAKFQVQECPNDCFAVHVASKDPICWLPRAFLEKTPEKILDDITEYLTRDLHAQVENGMLGRVVS
eukprot:GILJ01007504.1.p1 GENE.GILJ01007504.1~~GILJ01007504.1.p1  ORF type:complete len:430 (+),score=47.29 GILJ01007504.1:53-1342(+)